ncbi:2-dehydro-3-deoxyphosphogluconate aldolase [Thermophilibacter mediterraneus]|uniref:2-dehydro-3-deoxyphosphogluconate aldolase n=1 Tax=Thermophilibacter mediterraneus TaxID=1871031 RepID=UPI000931B99A|nr:2-dehydro-3-deoxyphosphogluconate aldolase [Thermophilibacter mediterraneus]
MAASESPVELFGLRVAHVGVNESTREEAERTADAFCALLGVPRGEEPFPVSAFSGSLVEVMGNGGRGERGHIGLHVDDVDAAVAWYEARGERFDESSRRLDPAGSGRTYLIYFEREVAGFAIHLTVAD